MACVAPAYAPSRGLSRSTPVSSHEDDPSWLYLPLQCGFTIWPTNATLPNGSKYTYQVQHQYGDVIQQFVDSANAYGVGYGFYCECMQPCTAG